MSCCLAYQGVAKRGKPVKEGPEIAPLAARCVSHGEPDGRHQMSKKAFGRLAARPRTILSSLCCATAWSMRCFISCSCVPSTTNSYQPAAPRRANANLPIMPPEST